MSPAARSPLESFYDILGFLAQVRQPEEDKVWSRIVDKLAVVLEAEAASYFAYLPKLHQLIARHSLGSSSRQLPGIPISVGTGLCGWVAKHREPLLVNDAYRDKRFYKEVDEITGFETRQVLALPVFEQLELTGVVELLNCGRGEFTLEDLRFAEAACRATSLTLRALRVEAMVDRVSAYNASILDNMGGGFLAVDLRGRLMLANPSARRILKLSPDLPLNVPLEQALPAAPGVVDALMKTLGTRQAARRQELTLEVDGANRLLGYSTILIQDTQGNLTGAGIMFQDITGFKK